MEYIGDATEQDMLDAFGNAEGGIEGRGYPDRFLFTRFPRDCLPKQASLTEIELREVHLIRNEDGWLMRSGVNRSPAIAAEWVRLRPGLIEATAMSDYHRRMLAGELPPPIILVGPPDPTPAQLVVLEGNKRTVAGCIGGIAVEDIAFLVGTSPGIEQWAFYADGNDFIARKITQ